MKKRRRSEIFCGRFHRSRTYRKKVKREKKQMRARNKRLISKYPWLTPYNVWTGKLVPNYNYDYISVWDEIPDGWIKAFGEMMCQEITEALAEDDLQDKVYVEQAKEKYGQLRIYMSGNKKALRIIDKYSAISENVCIKCGRPHSPMLNTGWICPECKHCFELRQKKYPLKGAYEDYASENLEHWKIPNELKWTIYSKEGNRIETMDITETVKRIEDRWNAMHPDRADEWCT